MKWLLGKISGFAASPFSGYLLIGLLVAAAGAGYWFWTELKEFGSLEAVAEEQAATIEQQRESLGRIQSEIAAKDAALQKQTAYTKQLRSNARLQQLAVQEAMRNADKAIKQCLDMRIARGMCFGPGCKDSSGKDKAGSDLDG